VEGEPHRGCLRLLLLLLLLLQLLLLLPLRLWELAPGRTGDAAGSRSREVESTAWHRAGKQPGWSCRRPLQSGGEARRQGEWPGVPCLQRGGKEEGPLWHGGARCELFGRW
jgi:hypothetical protein